MKPTIALLIALLAAAPALGATNARVEFKTDEAKGQLQILVDGREALAWQYGPDQDMVHCYPVRSPSGKLLTIQKTTPYPHHRSFWFGDTVQLDDGPKVSFYQPLYSRVDKKDPKSPYRDQIRLVKFTKQEVTPAGGLLAAQLVWVTDQGKKPVMDDVREMRIVPLGDGEYFLDCRFTVTAAYGDVKFLSDAAHYAWPYVRMHPQFAVEQKIEEDKAGQGENRPGTITNSEGQTGGKATCLKVAKWVDYSATVAGATEGLAMFGDPGQPSVRWFTRDYGTWGPRRADAQSGKPFTLRKGESLAQRVGMLVHRGDVKSGRVAERYRQYMEGKL